MKFGVTFPFRTKLIFLLSIMSILLCSFLIGNPLSSFFTLSLCAAIISAIVSLFQIRSFSKAFFIRMLEMVFLISFSLLFSLIFLVFAPFVLFHDFFLNPFVIIFIYVFPAIMIFVFSFCFFYEFISQKPNKIFKLLRVSLTISFIFTITACLAFVAAYSMLYFHYSGVFNAYLSSSTGVSYPKNYIQDLKIYDDIEEVRNSLLVEYRSKYFQYKYNTYGNLCFSDKCAQEIYNKIYLNAQIVISSLVTNGNIDTANREYALIQSGEIEKNYSTLENYSEFLSQKISSSPITFTMSDDFSKLDTIEFTDPTFSELIASLRNDNDRGSYFGSFSSYGDFKESPLRYSFSIIKFHTTLARDYGVFLVRMLRYTTGANSNPLAFVPAIQRNLGANETVESKIIRRKLILSQIERLEAQKGYLAT